MACALRTNRPWETLAHYQAQLLTQDRAWAPIGIKLPRSYPEEYFPEDLALGMLVS